MKSLSRKKRVGRPKTGKSKNSLSPPLYRRGLLFSLFFISGFCGLLYQIIWMRIAFISFGIILPVVSVVISIFMFGLSMGSWMGGKILPYLKNKTKKSALLFYALAEIVIGIGAFVVPQLFHLGEIFHLRWNIQPQVAKGLKSGRSHLQKWGRRSPPPPL